MPEEPIILDNEELQVSLASIAYYLYKQAGCPFGEGPDGFGEWMLERHDEFAELVEHETPAAAPEVADPSWRGRKERKG